MNHVMDVPSSHPATAPQAWELLQDLAAGLLQEYFTQDPKILLSVQRRSA